ncbi:hypothetical protein [Negadavirga shengliensis]|uniref:Uncharacterized protein n=1 Tax=Negadavirga shengliensis TaxID=1389218 RepID=A0ABV9SV10_9BACT
MGQLKNVLGIMLVLVLLVAAYLVFRTDVLQAKVDGADLVSANAVFVFETYEPVSVWNQLVNQPIWSRLTELPALKALEAQLIHLDSLAGKSGNLDKAFKGHKFTVSLHPVGREEYGFLFSVTFQDKGFLEFLKDMETRMGGQVNVKTRNYSGVTIYESTPRTSHGKTFTYAVYKNVLIGSYASFLVEDGIRYGMSGELKSFREGFPHLYKHQPQPSGSGILRITGNGFAGLVDAVSSEKGDVLVRELSDNGFSANLLPGFTDTSVLLRGDLFVDGEAGFTSKVGRKFNKTVFANQISNRTAVLHQYLIDNLTDFKFPVNKAFEARSTVKAELEEEFAVEAFFSTLSGEIALLTEEDFSTGNMNKVLLLKSTDALKSRGFLWNFSIKQHQGETSQLFREMYLGHEIFLMTAEEFPAYLFEGNFSGFSNTYITVVDNTLVLANSIRAIKNFIDDIYNDNTWGKSLAQKKRLDALDREFPYHVLINNEKFYTTLSANSAASWTSLFQKYAPLFQSFKLFSFGMIPENGKVKLNAAFEYELGPQLPGKALQLNEIRATSFDKPIISAPVALQNFNDRSTEYLIQDEDLGIHLVSSEGEVVFSYFLGERMLGQVYQIDYYKNNKLQLVFATGNGIYAFDRFGDLLPGYPIRFRGEGRLEFFDLVDYDNTKDYRYFLADSLGNLYVYDQYGSLLDGWDPRPTSGPLSVKPSHHRIPSLGDYMVSLHKNGNLALWNRKGESRTGSAVRLGESLSSEYALEEEEVSTSSRIVTLNDAGEVVKANFKGELTYRNQLLRPDKDTRFRLVKDQNGLRFTFVIEEFNKLTVLDRREEIVFEKNMSTDDLEFQFFSFGADNRIFVVIDKIQEFTYLYDGSGALINQVPLNSGKSIWISYSGSRNEYTIMAVHENRLSEYRLPL